MATGIQVPCIPVAVHLDISGGVSVKYNNPNVEIIVFNYEDVIRTSLEDSDAGGGTNDDVINAGSTINSI